MGKLKTKKTLSKRVRVTKNGLVVRKQTNQGHLKEKRDASRKGRKKKTVIQQNKGHIRVLKRLLAKASK